jgi:SWIM zinc finger
VPAFSSAEAARLADAVATDAALVAGLLNRQLDPALLAVAQQQGLALFPKRWSDLDMHCTCPDWAVPCKHLAAVVYLVSREIDGDPFKVFALRGMDLLKHLQKRGVLSAKAPPLQDLPALASLLATDWPPAPAQALDFSRLPPLLQPIWAVLQAQPGFYAGGDLRAMCQRMLAQAAKLARSQLDGPLPEGADPFKAQDRPLLTLDAQGQLIVTGLAPYTTALPWPAACSAFLPRAWKTCSPS